MFKLLFIFPLILILFTGCEKFMHPEEKSVASISGYNELASAVDGIYGQLAVNIEHYDNTNLKGDDLNTSMSLTPYGECSRSQATLSDTRSWEELYITICSANNILVQFKDISSYDRKTQELIAEVYFLRAYCYFRLTRLYGQIPLINDIEIKYNVPSASYLEIYQFIEEDLTMAINYLPATNNDARKPFVTGHRGVAKAILAEVYLSWAGYPIKDNTKYASAADLSKEVIDSSMFYGFKLLEDYAQVWDSSHFYNEESVFSIYYSNSWNFYDLIFKGCYYGEVGLQTHEVKHFLEYQFNPKLILHFPQVEISFYNNYPKNYRKNITFYTYKFILWRFINYDEYVGNFDYYNNISICDSVGYRKFFYDAKLISKDTLDDPDFNTFYFVGNPRVYIFRYAHTLLTYAESKARSGQPDAAAYEAINMIRRRANHRNIYESSSFDLPSGLSAETFADSVVWERAWEFAGEPEGRWFDLVRLEKVEDFPMIRNPIEGGAPEYPISKDDYFFNKPSSDFVPDPNL